MYPSVIMLTRLKELGYESSYSHRGKYYTLAEIPEFDPWGLWCCRAVWFSRHGNLLHTCRHFIEQAEAGLTAGELETLLHVEVKQPLLLLYHRKQVSRKELDGLYVYMAYETGQRTKQMLCRQDRPAACEIGTSPLREGLSQELKAALILCLSLLDEKQRRLYAGLESFKLGHGGDRDRGIYGAARAHGGPRAHSFLLFVFCLLLFVCLRSGCGYHFSGMTNLPQDVKSVRLAEFENETLEVGAEKELQWALEREFRNRGGLTISENGEGIVNGVLRQLDLRPISFDNKDQVLEYQLIAIFDISLTHRDSGKVLWQASGLRVTSDYSAIPQVVVTPSPEFQRGTLNQEDLQGLMDIQFSETERHLAMGKLFALAAREVYFRLGDDF